MSKSDYDRLLHSDTEDMQRNVLEDFSKNLPNLNRTLNGAVRWCDKCKHVKPDRTHHCSICFDCILKMDHHCPWVNNCISFTNYKYFLLFLMYSLIYSTFIALTTIEYFIMLWNRDYIKHPGNKFHILFLFFVAVMFAISLLSLFCYHCHLIANNRTTLEAFRAPIFKNGPDRNGYNIGTYNNFIEVFGNKKSLWMVPVFTSRGDGCRFPSRRHKYENDDFIV